MMLKNYNMHKKEGCKQECTEKCGQSFLSEIEIKKHLENECANIIICCIGCGYKDKRGLVNLHQLNCKKVFEKNRNY